VGPRTALDGCGKSHPTRIRSPDRPARNQPCYLSALYLKWPTVSDRMVQLRKAVHMQRLGSSWKRVRCCTNRSEARQQPEGTGRRKLVQMLQAACLLHKQLLAFHFVNHPGFSCALPPFSHTAIQPPAMDTCTEHTAARVQHAAFLSLF
jgi:hypothetical protein